MPVRAEAFLDIESSLADRLYSAWQKESRPLLRKIWSALEEGDTNGAIDLAVSINLSSLVEKNAAYIDHLSQNAILFGATRVTSDPRKTSIPGGNFDDILQSSQRLLHSAIKYNVEDWLRFTLLESIARYNLANPATNFTAPDGKFADYVLKYSPDQIRDWHGRWADEGGGLRAMYDRIAKPDGGFTYQPVTDDEPKEGFALSIYPDRSFAKEVKNLSHGDVVDYALRNADLLEKPDHYLGAWHDPESGKVFLDVSMVTQDEQQATTLALTHDQIAYFDLKQGKSVTVNREAQSGGAAKKGVEYGRGSETDIAPSQREEGAFLGVDYQPVPQAYRAGADARGNGRSTKEAGEREAVAKGGPGSGHFGHEGRPGEVGGSVSTGGSSGEPAASAINVKHLPDSLGIKRGDMPQIRAADMPEFTIWAAKQGIAVTPGTTAAASLKPAQEEYNPKQVAQMVPAALASRLTVSRDNYVLDGTNRWVRLVQDDPDQQININRIDLPAREALQLMHRFPKAFRKQVGQVGATVVKEYDESKHPRDERGRWVEFTEGDDTQKRYRMNTDYGSMTVIAKPDHLKIHDVSVAPEHRGKGHGKHLYGEAARLAGELNLPEMRSDYGVTEAAARVWRSMGGQEVMEGGSKRYRLRVDKDDLSLWDESEHPRQPAGSEQGGEFAPKDATSGADLKSIIVDFEGNYSSGYNERAQKILTKEQFDRISDAVLYYKEGKDSYEINRVLRHGASTGPKIQKVIEGLDEAFERVAAPITDAKTGEKKDVVVHRVINNGKELQLRVGDVVEDKGFVSTSYDPEVPEHLLEGHKDDALFVQIVVPKGTAVLPVLETEGMRHEGEILLNRASRFRVASLRGNKVRMELLSDKDRARATKSIGEEKEPDRELTRNDRFTWYPEDIIIERSEEDEEETTEKWDESAHPREPAGSERGGEFSYADAAAEARATPEYKALAAAHEAAAKVLDTKRKALLDAKKAELVAKIADNPQFQALLDPHTLENMAVHMVFSDKDVLAAEGEAASKAYAQSEQFLIDYVAERAPPVSPFEEQANQVNPQTTTREFKTWFGDSKTVGEDGNPLVVFHGTKDDIEEFNTRISQMPGAQERNANNNWCGPLGTWFTGPSLHKGNYDPGNAESTAGEFSEGPEWMREDGITEGAVIYPVYLSIKNPKEFDGYDEFQDEHGKDMIAYREKLIKQGHDGVVIRNSMTDGDADRDDWVAFNPEQIKSAIGNVGKFDPKSRHIAKWDEEKHPREPAGSERGGEFTSSGEGGGAAEDVPFFADLYNMATAEDVHAEAAKQKIPPGQVSVSTEAKTFKVGNHDYNLGGTADATTKEIVIYINGMTKDGMPGVLAHEAMHLRYAYAREAMAEEQVTLRADSRDVMRPDGTIRDGTHPADKGQDYTKEYPALTVGMDINLAKLEKSDGISPYSRAWWEDSTAKGGMTNPTGAAIFLKAINETLAEMNRLKLEGGNKVKHHAEWETLYRQVNQIYAATTGYKVPRLRGPARTRVMLAEAEQDNGFGHRVFWLDKDWNVVEEKDAVIGKIVFDDGSNAFILPVKSIAKWDEADHPRVPAGDPHGGEFTVSNPTTGIEGLPKDVNISGKEFYQLQEALERREFRMRVKNVRDSYGQKTYEIEVLPKIPEGWVQATGRWSKSTWYDPRYAKVDEDGYIVAIDKATFDYPKDTEEGHIFRGMSQEEYQESMERGHFVSRGGYNLGNEQEGLTYYSTDVEQAAHYASGFAPWQYVATPDKPAVVIKIKDPGGHVKVQGTGETEVGLPGTVPASAVAEVYEGTPFIVKAGSFDIVTEKGWRGGPSAKMGGGSGLSTSVRWAKRVRKYDDDQPREPKGTPEGGQWSKQVRAGEMGVGMTFNMEKKQWEHPTKRLSERDQQRLRERVTPPGWVNVHLNPDETAPLQVLGQDALARWQPRYSVTHTKEAALAKFARGRDFAKISGRVVTQIETDMANPDKVNEAAAMRLIQLTGIRIGGEKTKGVKHTAIGASNLLGQHVKVDGDKITLSFTGKSAVRQHMTVNDPMLASYLRGKGLVKGEPVFGTTDAKMREYFKATAGDEFKVKDVRMWRGTAEALKELKKVRQPKNEKEFKAMAKAVATKVSKVLGNTPAQSLSAYIDPLVWQPWNEKFPNALEPKKKVKKSDIEDMQELVDEFYELVSFDGPLPDWHEFPETGLDPDDNEEDERIVEESTDDPLDLRRQVGQVEQKAETSAYELGRQVAAQIVRPFVSFRESANSEAEKMLQLVSGLHTSRLSAFGFTVEASVTGVTTYAISAQLDNRVCPVCEEMHGREFQVEDASDALGDILKADDPDDLRTLQPWPKQDAQNVAEMGEMSEDELVDRNWHLPPYHPNCRCLLVKVEDVHDVKRTPSYLAAHPLLDSVFSNMAVLTEALSLDDAVRIRTLLGGETGSKTKRIWNQLKDTYGTDVLETLMGTKDHFVQSGAIMFPYPD